nr:feruloyl CoA ortho-hydroxylase 1-like [Ipomoea batatas]
MPSATVLSNVLSDINDFVVKQGHGVKGLSELGLQTLPNQYVHPPEERLSSMDVVSDDSIPVIDVSNWEDPKVAKLICDAAEKRGFFQIVNHGIPLEMLEKAKAATYRFFREPAEEKKKYSKENCPTSHVRYSTSFLPQIEKALEWKDHLSMFYVSDEEAAQYWPPSCRDDALEYLKSCEMVSRKLLEALMQGLNVNQIDNAKESLLMGSRRININYYPKCPNPDLTVGVGRHSDISTLTLLLQDDIGGLYVRKLEHEAWSHVPPVKGALVINIGDALQIMSNGRYKSIEHRVMANESNDRISVPVFVNPKPNDIVGPLPEVLASGEKPVYKPVLYSDYAKHFYRKAHNGKDTIAFARIE